jgi:hypothetical protein
MTGDGKYSTWRFVGGMIPLENDSVLKKISTDEFQTIISCGTIKNLTFH